jgi:hypothetical protein
MVIAVNGWDEDKEMVQEFVNKEKLKHTVLLMGSKVAEERFGVSSYPSTFWLDHQGKVLRREMGFAPFMAAAMERQIQRLIAGRSAAKDEASKEAGGK